MKTRWLTSAKHRAYQKTWRKKNHELVKAYKRKHVRLKSLQDPGSLRRNRRRYHLKTKYGLALEQYEAMLTAQNGVCAVCLQGEHSLRRGTLKSLDVDHCHKTGQVRGLLCSACNASLGLLKEDPLRIKALLDYIERSQDVR